MFYRLLLQMLAAVAIPAIAATNTTQIDESVRNGSFELYNASNLRPNNWSIYYASSYGVTSASTPGPTNGSFYLAGTSQVSTATNQLVQMRGDQNFTIDPSLGQCFILEYDARGGITNGFNQTNSTLVPLNSANAVVGIANGPIVNIETDSWTHVRAIFYTTEMASWGDTTTLNLRIALLGRANTGQTRNGYIDNVRLYQCQTPVTPGLSYEYFQGSWSVLPAFENLTPVSVGHLKNISLAPRQSEYQYAFRFEGYIDIATTGSHTFYLRSDDGSKLYIDGTQVINNDGLHGPVEVSGTVTLTAGLHPITIDFFQLGGGALLELRYAGPGFSKQLVPDSAFFQVIPPITIPDMAYPRAPYLIPLSQAANLQSLLDQYQIVRFEIGDYRTQGPSTLQLDSSYQLYGLQGTILPELVVPAGTTEMVLSNLQATSLTFTPGIGITASNFFTRLLNTPIEVDNASLMNNLFVGTMNCKFIVDNELDGFMRYNRFIRMNVHAAYPQLVMVGNQTEGLESYGNVFCWFNFLTPGGDATWIEHQQDLTMTAIDAETWNYNGSGGNPLFHTGRMGTLRIFGAQGGNHGLVENRTGLLSSDADQIQLTDVHVETGGLTDPNITYGANNLRSSRILGHDYSVSDLSSGAFGMAAFIGGSDGVTFTDSATMTTLTTAQQAELRQIMANDGKLAWEDPLFSSIPDPAGPNWDQNLASQPDSTSYIQNLLDTQTLVQLDAGTYYISSPLQVAYGGGIIGAGMDKTVIIAKNSNIDMIMPATTTSTRQTIPFVLTDITLQGGANGILCSEPGNQYNKITLSHVTMRDMTEAGIQLNSTYAWDNNIIDHVNIVDSTNGVLQIVDPAYTGGDTATMTFMDKNFWYQCQFVNCGIALNLYAERANNLNAYYQCRFSGSTTSTAILNNNLTTLFASCLFDQNAGSPSINRAGHIFLNCTFNAGPATSLMENGNRLDGCRFNQSGGNATILGDTTTTRQTYFGNCVSSDVPLGLTGGSQLLINSSLTQSGLDLNHLFVVIQQGTATTVLADTPDPAASILTGSRLLP